MKFMETSAKTGHNIDETFKSMTGAILLRIDNGEIDLNKSPPGIKVGQVKHAL